LFVWRACGWAARWAAVCSASGGGGTVVFRPPECPWEVVVGLCRVAVQGEGLWGVTPPRLAEAPEGRNAMALPLSRRDERCAQGSGELPASKYTNAAALLRRGAKQGGSASFGLARHIAL